MKRSLFTLVAAAGLLTGCDGLREAMTAHVDVVAKAGSQELSVDRLAELLGNSNVPSEQVNREVAEALADLWVNYQLLAESAARGDSLKDPTRIDQALWSIHAQERIGRWHQTVSASWGNVDQATLPQRYAQGEVLAARHILLLTQPEMTPPQRDSVRQRAEAVRAQVTRGDFAAVARRVSEDPGSKERGGDLGVFPRGMMVPDFERAVLALQPGEVSPVVQTAYGYHIIRRSNFDEVSDQLAPALTELSARSGDSLHMARLEEGANIRFRNNAATEVKGAVKDLRSSRRSRTVLATSRAGDFTVGRFSQWLEALPQRDQVVQMLPQVPDSVALSFARQMMMNDLVLWQADSANVQLDTAHVQALRGRFGELVVQTWESLGVSPHTLADSAQNEADRRRVAATRVERYIDRLVANPYQTRFVTVPQPLEETLRQTYDARINSAGLDRAVQKATRARAQTDSVTAAQRPHSQVPMPGAAGPQNGGQQGAPQRAPEVAPAPVRP